MLSDSPRARSPHRNSLGHPVRAVDQIVLGPATLAVCTGESATRCGELTPSASESRFVSWAPPLSGHRTRPPHPSLGVGAVVSNQVLGKGTSQESVCGPSSQPADSTPAEVPFATGLADGRRITAMTNSVFAHVPLNSPCNSDSVDLLHGAAPGRDSQATAPLGSIARGSVAFWRSRRWRHWRAARRLGSASTPRLGDPQVPRFRRRQLAAAVAWQASGHSGVGVLIGAPLGALLGRWLWTLFARAIYVVPEPTVPWMSIVLVAVGTWFANLLPAIPGRLAAATQTAVVLRAE